MAQTLDATTALEWAHNALGEGSPVDFLLAPARFVAAERAGSSYSMTLERRGLVGVAFGPSPPVDPAWDQALVSESALGGTLGRLRAVDQWDFFSRRLDRTSGNPPDPVEASAVEPFLRAHAPDSAVWPGNPEVVAWFGRRDASGLAAVAALVRWESDRLVVSSVATRVDARGAGHATALVEGVAAAAAAAGEAWLGLGVGRDNAVAQRVYERCGFARRARFTVYRGD
ncbi:MAG TPA: GNAT family N-acetyltransferase [Acidimicrobiales bacterium]|nr:GNAT family N-acetyltransferase [Acidimicrobiales bacterium]